MGTLCLIPPGPSMILGLFLGIGWRQWDGCLDEHGALTRAGLKRGSSGIHGKHTRSVHPLGDQEHKKQRIHS